MSGHPRQLRARDEIEMWRLVTCCAAAGHLQRDVRTLATSDPAEKLKAKTLIVSSDAVFSSRLAWLRRVFKKSGCSLNEPLTCLLFARTLETADGFRLRLFPSRSEIHWLWRFLKASLKQKTSRLCVKSSLHVGLYCAFLHLYLFSCKKGKKNVFSFHFIFLEKVPQAPGMLLLFSRQRQRSWPSLKPCLVQPNTLNCLLFSATISVNA